MELVGQIAEARCLSNVNDMSQLVGTFKEQDKILGEGIFPEVRKSLIRGLGEKQKQIRRVVTEISRDFYLPSQIRDVEKALESLAEEYLCSEFGMHYDRISGELFQLNRKINYFDEQNHKNFEIVIPLFASIVFGSGKEWAISGRKEDSYNSYKFEIAAKTPPMTREVKEKAKKAMAEFSEIYSMALKQPAIGDILIRDVERFSRGGGLDLMMYWIPSPSELKINVAEINKDPFLVAKLYSKHYLITTWDVKGEEPYEHYIIEFTEEKAKKP